MPIKKAAKKVAGKRRPKPLKVSKKLPVKPEKVAMPVGAVVDQGYVRRQLALAWRLHREAKPPGPGHPRPDGWEAKLREAYDARVLALAADPDRTSPAWGDDERLTPAGHSTHKRMMAFYERVRAGIGA